MAYVPSNINFGEVLLRALENQKKLKLDERQVDIEETRARTTEEYMKRQQTILQKQLENEQKQTAMAESRARMEGMTFEDMFTPLPIAGLPKEMQRFAKGVEIPNKPGFFLKKDLPSIEEAWSVQMQTSQGRDPWLSFIRQLQVEEIKAKREFAGAQDLLRRPSAKPGISLDQLTDYKSALKGIPFARDVESMAENLSPAFKARQNTFRRDPDIGAGGIFDLLDPVMTKRKEYGDRNFAEMFSAVGSVGGEWGMVPDQDILDQGAGALFALESIHEGIKTGDIQGGQRSMWNPQTTLEEDVRTAISMIRPRIEQYRGTVSRDIEGAMASPSVVRQRMIMGQQD